MRRAASAAACAFAVALTGCSAIVGGSPGPILCDPNSMGAEVCPSGQACVGGVCASCTPRAEQCNGIDDDCDGLIDDGLDVDLDGDGVPGCTGGVTADCDDDDERRAPGLTDVCNGIDDDCDLSTIETCTGLNEACGPPVRGGDVRCLRLGDCRDVGCLNPDGTRDDTRECDEATGVCNARTINCLRPGQECEAPLVCSPETLRCVMPRAPLGARCAEDAECASGLCYPAGAFEQQVCSRSCCDDADCGAQAFCAALPNGVRGCLPGELPVRQLCTAELGCASQACTVEMGVFQCLPSTGGLRGGEVTCFSHADCESNFCRRGECLAPCGSRQDCVLPEWSEEATCRPWFRDGQIVTACMYSFETFLGSVRDFPDKRQGEGCAGDSECRDDYCALDASPHYCSDTCCNDTYCTSGYRCEPVYHAGSFEMRCVRP